MNLIPAKKYIKKLNPIRCRKEDDSNQRISELISEEGQRQSLLRDSGKRFEMLEVPQEIQYLP